MREIGGVRETLTVHELDLALRGLRAQHEEKLQHIMNIVNERDRLYGEKFLAERQLTTMSLDARKELTSQKDLCVEKAIQKAEEMQKEINVRTNEFRQSLDDYTKTLMPRPEATVRFESIEKSQMDMKEVIDKGLGTAKGVNAMWGILVSLISIAISLGLGKVFTH